MRETTLYFVRHGETDFNRRRIVQGRKVNSSLNALGRSQAEALAQRFAGVPLDAIYCSTLRRAEETAEAVAQGRPGLTITRLRDLEEISWGVYEGRSVNEEVASALEEMTGAWERGDYGYAVPEGESILDVQARALRALDAVLERHAGGRVLVVTHGRFLRVLLATLLEEYGLARMHEIHHANTSVNHLVLHEGTYRAAALNCTAHLDAVEIIEVE